MRKLLLLLFAVGITVAQLQAQTRVITGKVTGPDGSPIPNTSITVKGSNYGTTSKADGTYIMSIPDKSKVLVFSAIGMLETEVSIGNKTVIDMSLKPNDQNLAEVVVVGYGTQKKRNVTSSIVSVKGNDIAGLSTPSFDKQLGGRAAGVQVTNSSGLVNQAPRIRIRGVNSISQGRDPLFVVDGVPVFSSGNSGVANTNPLGDINPADIESIDILKDGAATAIYGSRAANGVVLITTKKGKAGKISVNYDGYVAVNSVFKKPELLNAFDFVTISNEKFVNANNVNRAKLRKDSASTDWLDAIFKDNPVGQSHTLSLSGGNEKTTYYFSLNYNQQDGIIRTNYARKFGVRANFEHKVNRFFKIGNNITLSRIEDNDQNNGGNSLSGGMGAALRALPNVSIYNPANSTGYNLTPARDALGKDSNTRAIENNYSNIAYVMDKNKFNSDKYRIINNAFIEIMPVEWLTIRSQASIDYQQGTDFQSLDPLHGDGRSANGIVFNQSLQRSRYVWQNYLNVNHSFGFHTLGVTVGTEMQRDVSRNFSGTGNSVTDPFFMTDNLISGSYATQFSGGSYGKSGFQSYFGRVSYDYKGKYFLQLSMRRDGQSSLSEDKRYGNFPGGSVGWRVSEEEFWQNSGIGEIFSDLKLRGSYAVVGNTLGGFPYLSTYSPAPYGGLGGIAFGVRGNPDLKWETNKKIDAGIDLSILRNRINITADYFVNQNDDLVLDAPTPPSIGVPGNVITSNVGTMENKGVEITVSANIINNSDFTWSASANFTSAQNKVKSLVSDTKEQLVPGPNNGTFNILRVGEPINGIYGFEYAGVNSANGNPMWKKADGSLVQYNNVTGSAAGYYLVVKPDDATLGAATTLATTDRKILGNAVPTWFGGITNTFTYQNFTFDCLIRYSGGNKVYNLTRQEVLNSLGFINNGTEVLGRWTTAGQKTDVPKLFYGRDNVVNLQGQANSRFLENGNFVRLQNITVSYKLDADFLEKATSGFVKSFRFYLQGQNLAIWSKYKGIDPENYTELGIDNSSVPQLRTFTAGVNVGF